MKFSTRILTIGPRSVFLLAALLAVVTALTLFTKREISAKAGPPEVLAAPEVIASATGGNAIELSWTTVSGAVRYELLTRAGGGWEQLEDDSLTGTTYSHTGLSSGATYYYLVHAIGANGVLGEWSGAVSAKVSAPPPPTSTATPAPVQTGPGGGPSPPGKANPGSGPSPPDTTNPGDGPSPPGTTSPGGGSSPPGATRSGGGSSPPGATSPGGGPSPQGGTNPGGGSSPPGATDPGGGPSPRGATNPGGGPSPPGATSIPLHTPATPPTPTRIPTSEPTAEATATASALLKPGLAAEASVRGVELRWGEAAGAVRYELAVWWDTGIGWQPVGSGDLTGTTYTHTEVAAGKTYYYSIRAVNAAGKTVGWLMKYDSATALEATGAVTPIPTPVATASATSTPVPVSTSAP